MKRYLMMLIIPPVMLVLILTSGSSCEAGTDEVYHSQISDTDFKSMIETDKPVMVSMDNTFEVLEQEKEPEPEPDPVVMYFTEDDVIKMAKVLYRECRGIPSDTEKACVAWVACNRVDSDEFPGDTIEEILTARYQFAYYYDTPVTDELYELALDVLTRWNAERNGEQSVGRVLPADYTFFAGDGVHNYFRNAYKSGYSIWDYSLPSPYDS